MFVLFFVGNFLCNAISSLYIKWFPFYLANHAFSSWCFRFQINADQNLVTLTQPTTISNGYWNAEEIKWWLQEKVSFRWCLNLFKSFNYCWAQSPCLPAKPPGFYDLILSQFYSFIKFCLISKVVFCTSIKINMRNSSVAWKFSKWCLTRYNEIL